MVWLSSERLRRVSVFGGALMFLAYPASVSVSQTGLGLALLGWAGFAWRRRAAAPAPDEKPLWKEPALLAALGVYAAELLSLLVNSALSPAPLEFFGRGVGVEFKDFWLVGAAFWTAQMAGEERFRQRLHRWLEISIWILLISGFVSIFSKWRLSKIPYHLLHGWEASAAARFQHLQATLFPDAIWPGHLYMPIGLLNTHLTYASLLCLALPWLLLRFLNPLLTSPGPWRQRLRGALVPGAALLIAAIILALNSGRSALLGGAVAALIAMSYYIIVHWRQRAILLAPLAFLGVLTIVILDRSSPAFHDRFERVLSALSGQAKHTDVQRTLVWNGTLRIIGQAPLVGVGPGAYEPAVLEDITAYGRAHPRLWAEYELAQRGHAHNDMLHLLAIAGPLAVFAYLALFARLSYIALRDPGGEFHRFGPLILLFGGLFQCYFQDDETLLPFWLYVGLAIASYRATARATS